MRQKVFYIGAALLAVIVAYAFSMIGTPSHNRSLLQDRQTLNMLRCVACAAQKSYCQAKALPADNKAIIDFMRRDNGHWCSDYHCDFPNDKFDESLFEGYRYERRGEQEYAVCGTFQNSSEVQEINQPRFGRGTAEFQDYPAGEHCFTLKAKPAKNSNSCY